jgi:hypothetical protein
MAKPVELSVGLQLSLDPVSEQHVVATSALQIRCCVDAEPASQTFSGAGHGLIRQSIDACKRRQHLIGALLLTEHGMLVECIVRRTHTQH